MLEGCAGSVLRRLLYIIIHTLGTLYIKMAKPHTKEGSYGVCESVKAVVVATILIYFAI